RGVEIETPDAGDAKHQPRSPAAMGATGPLTVGMCIQAHAFGSNLERGGSEVAVLAAECVMSTQQDLGVAGQSVTERVVLGPGVQGVLNGTLGSEKCRDGLVTIAAVRRQLPGSQPCQSDTGRTVTP